MFLKILDMKLWKKKLSSEHILILLLMEKYD